MRRERLARRGLKVADVLLVAGIALMPVLAWKGIRLVEFGLIPLIAAPWVWRRIAPDRNDWIVIALFGQYAVLVTLNVVLYPELPGVTGKAIDKVGLYLGAAVTLVLMVMRFGLTPRPGRLWRVIAPIAILASVALLAWDHFTLPYPENCRVSSVSKHLFIPPLWLTVLALASYHGWSRLAPWERWVRHLSLALVILATVAFSGARGVLVAQAASVPLLALLLGMGEPAWRRVRVAAVVGAAATAGLAGGLALDFQAGCKFSGRLGAILHAARADDGEELAERSFEERLRPVAPPRSPQEPAPSVPGPAEARGPVQPPAAPSVAPGPTAEDRQVGGVFIRVIIWKDALARIAEAPLAGHGYLNEEVLVVGDFPHYHQQYLSWLVWGGPLMLVSGLVMLLAPLATFRVRRSRDGAILALAMIGPLAVDFLTETILLHTVMILGYVMTLGLMHALARESAGDHGPP